MKSCYLIIGDAGVGKSSLIRCLTGNRRYSETSVRLVSGVDLTIWCWVRSLQETTPIKTPNELIKEITGPEEEEPYKCYLIPLRHEYLDQPNCNAQDYIDILLKNGIKIEGIAVLSRNSIIPHVTFSPSVKYIDIPFSKMNPPNYNAHLVRRMWGWL